MILLGHSYGWGVALLTPALLKDGGSRQRNK
ncbi:hypothetical protein HMF8227_01916 [Saliniradius amylolyticus]|uniref:Uncharacterized protein n=1 Tax=Saliniradius amylolyticus TaxID=2183582 RepID=A0A2S2E403_9ALTE|nr:hypothetical protein HMF8227_01916 [Saliniradius amylolyticus]